MDYKTFLDMAKQLKHLKMFPYFEIAHSLLSAIAVRQDLAFNAKDFSRRHPLACWISTMLVMFAGDMIFNGLLGEAILSPFQNTSEIIVGTIVWYVFAYYNLLGLMTYYICAFTGT